MKKRRILRVVAMMTVALFLLLPVSASSGWLESSLGENHEQETSQNLSRGDMSLQQLQTAKLAEEDIPEPLTAAEIATNGNVHRLRLQESTLNTAIFQNVDGTKTLYNYAEPIKYIDEAGNIVDKDNSITTEIKKVAYADKYQYTNKANDIKTYFPATLDKDTGIIVEHDQVKIEVVPELAAYNSPNVEKEKAITKKSVPSEAKYKIEADENGKAKDTVQYARVFGAHTNVKYTPLFRGYKEDIVLEQYTGINIFSFLVQTNGLQLMKNGSAVVFTDPKTKTIRASLGDLKIYDSSAHKKNDEQYHHAYHTEEVKKNQLYRVNIVVDASFLESEKTVYPVVIDPTVTIKYKDSTADMSLFYGTKTTDGDENRNYVGKRTQGSYGKSRFVAKFPGLMSEMRYNHIASSQITKAQYVLKDIEPDRPKLVVDVLYMTKDWTELSNYSSSLWGAGGSVISSRSLYYGNGVKADLTKSSSDADNVYYNFNILNAVKAWRNGSYGGFSDDYSHYGIMIKAQNEDRDAHRFASNEATTAANMPRVVMTYTEVKATGLTLSTRGKNITIPRIGDTAFLDIEVTVSPSNTTNQGLTFTSSNTNIATVSADGTVTAKHAGQTKITIKSKSNTALSVTSNVTVTTGDYDTDGIIDTEDMDPYHAYRRAVILLHGRGDNVRNAFGLKNKIVSDTELNNTFNAGSMVAAGGERRFDNYFDQYITGIVPNTSSTYVNLANVLISAGYSENVDLFGFNYPNRDAVYYNAKTFQAYINNLIAETRNSTEGRKAAFYRTVSDYNNNRYTFDLVGHSMGGLVARYYIENLGQNSHVQKLITLDTPHWGSEMADSACVAGKVDIEVPLIGFGIHIDHMLCDHDLRPKSVLFGGTAFSRALTCTVLGEQCYQGAYTLSDTLNYSASRTTKYYAIGGLDHSTNLYTGSLDTYGGYILDCSSATTSIQFKTLLDEKIYEPTHISQPDVMLSDEISLIEDGDWMVNLSSQFGFGYRTTSYVIPFEKRYLYNDTDSGYFIFNDSLHTAIPHVPLVANQIKDLLKV